MEEIKSMLSEEIKREIEALSTLSPGSKEKSTAIDDLTKLYKLRIEENKAEEEDLYHHYEWKQKDYQLTEQVKDRYFRVGIAAAEIILPLIFYAVWMKMGFRFEETGSYTSTTFRGLFNRFRPTK